ncbi:MAG: hypothetical protein M3P93_11245, partial [Actinomycetota bacterium]|nr:hypothetical protein [Actinomycetota bacterium]
MGAGAAGVGQLGVPGSLGEDLDERVGAALPGRPVVGGALPAGERFQDGEQRVGVLSREDQPAAEHPVGVQPGLPVPADPGRLRVGLQSRFAVGGEQMRDVAGERGRVEQPGRVDQRGLRLGQGVRSDPADQPGEQLRLRQGERAVQHRLGDPRQTRQHQRGAQLCL